MKHTKETVQTTTVRRVVGVTCDRCGAAARRADCLPIPEGQSGNWQDVQVAAQCGDNWPEGGSGPKWETDLCARCFVDWLVPLLRRHGVVVREGRWDW